jgi:hypothetical protein
LSAHVPRRFNVDAVSFDLIQALIFFSCFLSAKTTEMLEKSEDKSKKVKAKIMREVAAGNAEYFAQNIISMENIHNRYVRDSLLNFTLIFSVGSFPRSKRRRPENSSRDSKTRGGKIQ